MLAAAGVYFLIVFAVGAVMGPLREFVLVPRIGAAPAVAVEAPVLLVAMWLAARWVLASFGIRSGPAERAGVGMSALALLLAVEASGAVWLRGMTVAGWLAHFATPAGALSLALFLMFAAMPLFVGARD